MDFQSCHQYGIAIVDLAYRQLTSSLCPSIGSGVKSMFGKSEKILLAEVKYICKSGCLIVIFAKVAEPRTSNAYFKNIKTKDLCLN